MNVLTVLGLDVKGIVEPSGTPVEHPGGSLFNGASGFLGHRDWGFRLRFRLRRDKPESQLHRIPPKGGKKDRNKMLLPRREFTVES